MVSNQFTGSMEDHLKELLDCIDQLKSHADMLRFYPQRDPDRDIVLMELTDLSYKIDECAHVRTQVYEKVINNLSEEYEVS